MKTIPEAIRRFILTSVDSVSFLEAMLLLRYDSKVEWDAKMMAQRLFVNDKIAAQLLKNLCEMGITALKNDKPEVYQYSPQSSGLKDVIDELAVVYSKNLIEVHNLIHSKINKQAQRFGDAFKLQKEKE